MTPEQAAALRAPFKPEQIGKLPKPTKADNPKGQCKECGGWHGLPAMHLDYVGHAATTDRLLSVDPAWTWEPMAVDAQGVPIIVGGGLWIKLTVCGVTRPGWGDGKNLKEMIGDAIRNAAMRFGVALDLWSKEDLDGGEPGRADKVEDKPAAATPAAQAPRPASAPEPAQHVTPPATQPPRPARPGAPETAEGGQFRAPVISEDDVKELWALVRGKGMPDAAFAQLVEEVTGSASTRAIPTAKLAEVQTRIEAWTVAA